MLPENLTELKKYSQFNPTFTNYLDRVSVTNYSDFIQVLYRDLDKIVSTLMRNPELRFKDAEDRLTIEIVGNLKHMGYDAKHDEKVGGHTDILVEKDDFLWIGEAKIDYSNSWIYKGFQQLSTRYSTGIFNQDCGAIIIYIKNPKMLQIMEEWKTYLTNKRKDVKTEQCKISKNCFVSVHEHERSGMPFYVRHIPVSIYFNAQDK